MTCFCRNLTFKHSKLHQNITMKRFINVSRSLYIGFVIAVFVVPLSSQTIKFNYDRSGNRILRELSVLNKDSEIHRKVQNKNSDTRNIYLLNGEITVGPSPTSGLIRIEIKGFSEFQKIQIYVHNIYGQIVCNSRVISEVTEISIENRPNGIYLVSVVINDIYKSYKIVKYL